MKYFIQRHGWILAGLAFFGFLLFMWGNGGYTLFDNSEPHYARVSQEMANTGHYLTLTFNGQPWFVHPPLYFWICSTWCKLWGWTEFNLRFTEGVFGILGLWGVYALGRRFFSPSVGVAGAVILATSLYYTVMSRLGIFDTLFNTLVLATLVCFFWGFYHPEQRLKWFLGAAVATILGVLTKGPFGLIQPFMGIIPFLIWKRQLKVMVSKEMVLAFGVFLVGVCPWYAYELSHFGWDFFNVALRDYTWYRVFGVVESQGGPWYYYFPVLLAYFPWIFFLPGILKQGYDTVKAEEGPMRDFIGFSWIWIVITFVFFSVTGTKLPNYIMGIFPFMSILIAHYMFTAFKPARVGIGVPLFASVLLGAAVFYPLPLVYLPDRPLMLIFFGLMCGVTWIFWILLTMQKRKAAMGVMGLGAVFWVLLLTGQLLPAYEKYKDIPDIVRLLKQPGDRPVVIYDVFSPSLYYYLNQAIPSVSQLEGLTHRRVVLPTDALEKLEKAHQSYAVLFKGVKVSLIQL